MDNQTLKFNKAKQMHDMSPIEMTSVVNKTATGEDNNLVMTIYHNAVKIRQNQQHWCTSASERDSLSSEEPLDTSDKLNKIPMGGINLSLEADNSPNVAQFISDVRAQQQLGDN